MEDVYFKLNNKNVIIWLIKFLTLCIAIYIALISVKLPISPYITPITALVFGVFTRIIYFFVINQFKIHRYCLWDDKHQKERTKPRAIELAATLRRFFYEENRDEETLQAIAEFIPYVPARSILTCSKHDRTLTENKNKSVSGVTNEGHNISINTPEQQDELITGQAVGNFLLWKWQNYLMIMDRNEHYEPIYMEDEEEQDLRFPPVLWINYDPKTLKPLDYGSLAFSPNVEFNYLRLVGFAAGVCWMLSESDDSNEKLTKSDTGFFVSKIGTYDDTEDDH